MLRRGFMAFFCVVALAACSGPPPGVDPVAEPIGDFRLGFNVVVSPDVQKAPASREATEDELNAAVRAAMEERLGRYDGDGLYHIGLRVEAYSLGKAGIPIVFSPRSIMLIAMNIWDNETQEKLNAEPIRITAFDGRAGPLVGGGLLRNRESQLMGLAYNAAREVEEVLIANRDTWFAPKAERIRVPFERDRETGLALENAGSDDAGAPGADFSN